jgi:hypothetical protein
MVVSRSDILPSDSPAMENGVMFLFASALTAGCEEHWRDVWISLVVWLIHSS